MMYFSTIDLDRRRGVLKIACEILRCENIEKLEIKRSPSGRGWHFSLFCKKKCLKCRVKYDDAKRLYADMTNRKEKNRNVLFDEKYKVKIEGGKLIILKRLK